MIVDKRVLSVVALLLTKPTQSGLSVGTSVSTMDGDNGGVLIFIVTAPRSDAMSRRPWILARADDVSVTPKQVSRLGRQTVTVDRHNGPYLRPEACASNVLLLWNQKGPQQ